MQLVIHHWLEFYRAVLLFVVHIPSKNLHIRDVTRVAKFATQMPLPAISKTEWSPLDKQSL
jgi:hypothetical protein